MIVAGQNNKEIRELHHLTDEIIRELSLWRGECPKHIIFAGRRLLDCRYVAVHVKSTYLFWAKEAEMSMCFWIVWLYSDRIADLTSEKECAFGVKDRIVTKGG